MFLDCFGMCSVTLSEVNSNSVLDFVKFLSLVAA